MSIRERLTICRGKVIAVGQTGPIEYGGNLTDCWVDLIIGSAVKPTRLHVDYVIFDKLASLLSDSMGRREDMTIEVTLRVIT